MIYLAFWNGVIPEPGKTPYPYIDRFCITQDWQYISTDMPGLRLTDLRRDVQQQMPDINPQQKFKFSWLADSIPNPRAIFYIKGKRYLCEKITATFTKNGLSQLLKGEFYPLKEADADD